MESLLFFFELFNKNVCRDLYRISCNKVIIIITTNFILMCLFSNLLILEQWSKCMGNSFKHIINDVEVLDYPIIFKVYPQIHFNNTPMMVSYHFSRFQFSWWVMSIVSTNNCKHVRRLFIRPDLIYIHLIYYCSTNCLFTYL